jgi:hypothetical protein
LSIARRQRLLELSLGMGLGLFFQHLQVI